MSDDEFEVWWDELAGHQRVSANGSGGRLRRMIIEEDQRLQEEILANHPPDDVAWNAVQLRLRREQSQERRQLDARYRLPLALAASVLIVGVLFLLERNSVRPTPAVYPTSTTPAERANLLHLRVPYPREAAESLQRKLSGAGINAAISVDADIYFIDFDIDRDVPTLRDALGKGLETRRGPNRIIIEPQ